jgi:hypothetical protein
MDQSRTLDSIGSSSNSDRRDGTGVGSWVWYRVFDHQTNTRNGSSCTRCQMIGAILKLELVFTNLDREPQSPQHLLTL